MNIRPAATLILTRDTDNGIEVLLLQRTWDAVFLPGYYVFPGGGAVNAQEPEGGRAHVVGVEDADISQTMSLDEGGGADYMLAAVRECFEEAGGILLAQDASGQLIGADHGGVHSERMALFQEEISLAQLCAKHGLTVPLDRLAYLSHWVTHRGGRRAVLIPGFFCSGGAGRPGGEP